jgi:hypothetical protein
LDAAMFLRAITAIGAGVAQGNVSPMVIRIFFL